MNRNYIKEDIVGKQAYEKLFDMISLKRMQIKNAIRFHSVSIRLANY